MNQFMLLFGKTSIGAETPVIFRKILALICAPIYSGIAHVCSLFLEIAKLPVDIINTTDIYGRFTMLLTVIMIFYVTFEFIKYIVSPKSLVDEEKGAGNLLKKMVVVVIMIAFVPTIFTYAMNFQIDVINDGVIFRLFGMKYDENGNNVSDFGYKYSSNMLGCFYRYNKQLSSNVDEDLGLSAEAIVTMNFNSLQSSGDLSFLHYGLGITGTENNSQVDGTYAIEFNGLFACVFGGIALSMLILYCFDLGIRYAKLMFLEIIAPIPIIGYLSEKKEGTFSKWLHQCIATYIDVFIRLAIFGLVLLLSNNVIDIFDDTNSALSQSSNSFLIKVIILTGLLLFLKKAPDLISTLLPTNVKASGSFGFSLKDRGLDKGFTFAKRTVGMAAGAAVGAATGFGAGIGQGLRRKNALNAKGEKKGVWAGVGGAAWGALRGATGGMVRGATNGVKKGNTLKNIGAGLSKEVAVQKSFGNRQESGYTLYNQTKDVVSKTLGGKSRIEKIEEAKAPLKSQSDLSSKTQNHIKAVEDRAISKAVDKNTKAGAAYTVAENRKKMLSDSEYVKQNFGNIETDQDAKKRYEEAVGEANAASDKAKDAAVYDYIVNAKSDIIKDSEGKEILDKKGQMIRDIDDAVKKELIESLMEIEEYNKTASNSKKIDCSLEKIGYEILRDEDNKMVLDSKGNPIIVFEDSNSGEKIVDFRKKYLQSILDTNNRETIGYDQEIEKIKREQAGSGIAGDKK